MIRKKCFGSVLLAVFVFLGITAVAPGQYKVFSWANFESGEIPKTLLMRHASSEDNLKVVNVSQTPELRGSYNGIAREELGNYVLQFSTTHELRLLSIMDYMTLDRKLLGNKGRALYQADIYIPPQQTKFGNVSVLAVVNQSEKGNSLYQFYRFGYQNSGKTAGNVFFSFVKDTGQPLGYHQQPIDQLEIKPGWHRFQIIFFGQTQILCAVDGKMSSFSPIEETSLRYLNAGIFAVGNENENNKIFIDNLSIQYTDEDVPLPDSPWLGGVSGTQLASRSAAPAPTASANTNNRAKSDTKAPLPVWQTDARRAWETAKAQNKPLLVLFYAPRIQLYKTFEQMLQSNPQTNNLLAPYTLLHIDVNQLRGGKLAEKFRIIKVPTIIILGADGNEKSRFIMRSRSTWEDIEAALKM